MAQARLEPGAVALPDGRVLVVGGLDPETGKALGSAELFDPSTGGWLPAASMGTPRVGHAVTLLPDGKVLVSGGAATHPDDPSSRLDTVEVFHPEDNGWRQGPPMLRTRVGHSAATLGDGSVLVLGGHYGNSATLERLDPAATRWTAAGELPFAPIGERIVPMNEGRVLLVNQQTGAFFNPSSGRPGPSLHVPMGPNATDPVFLAGLPSGRLLASADSFSILMDVQAGEARQTGSPGAARLRAAGATLASGLVLVVGGESWRPQEVGGTPGLTGEVYDEASGRWRPLARLITARGTPPTVVPLSDGRALVTGGGRLEAEFYVPGRSEACEDLPAASPWKATGTLNEPRVFAAGATLPDGRVLISGGGATLATPPRRSAEVFDLRTEMWAPAGLMAQGRRGHSLIELRDERVLAVGGGRSDAEIFDPSTSTWSGLESLPAAAGTAIGLADGTVVAGVTPPGTGFIVRDAHLGSWRLHPGGGLEFAVMARRGADEVLAFAREPCAGPQEPCFYAAAYLPVVIRRFEKEWTVAATNNAPRRFFPPTLVGLSSGAALALAGNEETSEKIHILPAGQLEWSEPEALIERRGVGVMAVELESGEVLVLGGNEGSEGHDNDWATAAEVFDPVTGQSRLAAAPFHDRFFGSVLLSLKDGRLLLAGGQGVVSGTASQVELLEPPPFQ